MIRRTIESYTKAIEGILDDHGNPVKWFVVVRTTIWVLWVIPVISWEEDSDGGDKHIASNVSTGYAGLYMIVILAVLAFVLFMTMVLVV